MTSVCSPEGCEWTRSQNYKWDWIQSRATTNRKASPNFRNQSKQTTENNQETLNINGLQKKEGSFKALFYQRTILTSTQGLVAPLILKVNSCLYFMKPFFFLVWIAYKGQCSRTKLVKPVEFLGLCMRQTVWVSLYILQSRTKTKWQILVFWIHGMPTPIPAGHVCNSVILVRCEWMQVIGVAGCQSGCTFFKSHSSR